MRYILIEIDGYGPAYQEVDEGGYVTRYLDVQGSFLFDAIPTGVGSGVIDPEPPRLDWMV